VCQVGGTCSNHWALKGVMGCDTVWFVKWRYLLTELHRRLQSYSTISAAYLSVQDCTYLMIVGASGTLLVDL
jgi:hypothetical protein